MDLSDQIDDGTGVIRKSGFDFGFDPGACACLRRQVLPGKIRQHLGQRR